MSMGMKIAKAKYQGDPGLLGTLGGIVKTVGGIVGTVVPGVGAASSAIGGFLGGLDKPKAPVVQSLPGSRPILRQSPGTPGVARYTGGMMNQGQSPYGGGLGGAMRRAVTAGQAIVPGGVEPTGQQMMSMNGGRYRLNKTSYFLKDGTFVPAGSKWVKVRKRNSLNPRALSRAIGRVKGAKAASKTLGRISIRKEC